MTQLYGARISIFGRSVKLRFTTRSERDRFLTRHPDFRPIRAHSFPSWADAVSRAFSNVSDAEEALNA